MSTCTQDARSDDEHQAIAVVVQALKRTPLVQ